MKSINFNSTALASDVYLVGCGTGDVELLSIKAYKIISNANVVLYDHLIDPEILELVSPTALSIYVGKQKGCHSHSQDQINALICEHAQKGLTVARLKSGDPYIFGRGAEEAIYIQEEGYKVEVIAGISSALEAPASAGIPVTARNYATNFSVVSAHLKGSKVNLQWIDLLRLESHTTVVLMGLSLASKIQEAALKQGIDPFLDVAIISHATRPSQNTHITTLNKLAQTANGVESPAVLVFGDVVKLREYLPRYKEQNEKTAKEGLEHISSLYKNIYAH